MADSPNEPLVTLGYKKGGEPGYLTKFGKGNFTVYGGQIDYAIVNEGVKLTLYSEENQQGQSVTRRGPFKQYLTFDAYSYKVEKADPIDRAKDRITRTLDGLTENQKRGVVLGGLALLVLLVLNLFS